MSIGGPSRLGSLTPSYLIHLLLSLSSRHILLYQWMVEGLMFLRKRLKRVKLDLETWSKEHFGELESKRGNLIKKIGVLDGRDEVGSLSL